MLGKARQAYVFFCKFVMCVLKAMQIQVICLRKEPTDHDPRSFSFTLSILILNEIAHLAD